MVWADGWMKSVAHQTLWSLGASSWVEEFQAVLLLLSVGAVIKLPRAPL